jgi:hypothetical protein
MFPASGPRSRDKRPYAERSLFRFNVLVAQLGAAATVKKGNVMNKPQLQVQDGRYAKCIEVSKRIRWEIDRDVIRGRRFDFSRKFLPDALSMVNTLAFLDGDERRQLSQIQGRTYANMFGLVERYISAKILDISRDHWFGDQIKLEALVRFTDEELKHQELFRRIETLAAEDMPEGYIFLPQANDLASVVLGKSTWAVLALTCHIELFTQAHYRVSVEPDPNLSELYKDVLLFHWKEESQHAILDELEWRRADQALSASERDRAVDELIELVVAVDGIVQAQAKQDAEYFVANRRRVFTRQELESLQQSILKAYRWQYILSGVQVPHFGKVLTSLITVEQGERIQAALSTLQ